MKTETKLAQIEVPKEVDILYAELMAIAEPYLQKIVKIFRANNIPIDNVVVSSNPAHLYANMSEIVPDNNLPPVDLVHGIRKILDINYQNKEENILGVKLDKNLIVANDISRILVAARKRDRDALINELNIIIGKIKI